MNTTSTSTPNDYILNPDKNMISLFDTDILVEVVNGRLDLNVLAMKELNNRGLDKNGVWFGFDVK
jgi:hypothetical protein